ncbi:sugar-binding domain-containing protein [Fibrobacter succinogenes]|uniref:sugar-binding domain-containing protein n=1 Tax=Fibrobacter succinogenes TaxID=833 RepID=UPI001567FCE9|nr:sugar-binding domain-containing protein [Fibrobacter succinogenes]
MSKIISLDGDWQMIWDTEDTGISNRWYATYPEKTQTVSVPHIWERAFDKLLMAQDCAFYFKRFTIDDEKQVTKRIFLRFEKIATHATIWLNGKLLGDHFGAYTSFVIETQKAIKLGEENILCIRVANMGATNSRIDFGRESKEGANDRYAHPGEMPVGLPWSQYPYGGICGHVDLILGNAAFISDIHVEPDMDQERVSIEAFFNNPRGYQSRLRILMKNPNGDVYEYFKDIKLEKENATQKFLLGIKDWKKDKCVWSPERPNLFAIEMQLEIKGAKGKAPEYTFPVVKTFGFRKFDCLKGDYYINDSIVKLMGVSYNQQWSEGGLWTDQNPALEKDLNAVKAAGFNVIRSCGAPLSSTALDICDKIGLFVFQEFPIHTMRSTAQGLEITKKLINDMVRDQHNHPCIAAWILGSENGTFMLQNGNKLLNAISPIDTCRPAISNFNSIYLDNEANFHKDTGKIIPVSIDRISQYATMRVNPRLNPSAAYTHYLAHMLDKEDVELMVPDTGLGDSHFQDEEEPILNDIENKVLVTLKNNTLFPKRATTIAGPRSVKSQKAIKNEFKSVETFVADNKLSIWPNFESFNADVYRIALKSKYDQITAFQSNPQIAGFFIDQWADNGTDFSGFTDENRKSKGIQNFAREITAPSRVLISELEHVVTPQSEVSFQLTLLNNSRLEDVEIEVSLLDAKDKVINTQKVMPEEPADKKTLTQLGICTLMAPRATGLYKIKLTLKDCGKEVHSSYEDLIVIDQADVKDAMSKVCFLDNYDESSDVLAALDGSEQIIFTANLSSWPDEILEKIIDVTKNGGKTLLLSDMTTEDIDLLNQSHNFENKIEAHWTTGANEFSLHYLPKDSPLLAVFGGNGVLDHNSASAMPGISLNELAGAKVYARSVTLKDGEIKTGVDLQLVPFGKGQIMFNQFSVIEGLETNALSDALFTAIVNLL